LPGEIRTGGSRDGRPQLGIDDGTERTPDLRRQRLHRRHGSRHTPLGRAVDAGKAADPEAELADRDTALAEPLAHRVREQRHLVRPNAARHPQKQHPVEQGNGMRPVGDSRADRFSPQLACNRRVRAREPIFSGTVEDGLERFGRGERGAALRATHA
jgi:hypothetical protein